MPKLECPVFKEELTEVIRVIEVRCRYDENSDDYLKESDEGQVVDLCPQCRNEVDRF
jgi:hypothetical protein